MQSRSRALTMPEQESQPNALVRKRSRSTCSFASTHSNWSCDGQRVKDATPLPNLEVMNMLLRGTPSDAATPVAAASWTQTPQGHTPYHTPINAQAGITLRLEGLLSDGGVVNYAPGTAHATKPDWMCPNPACREASWNGEPGEYCNLQCRLKQMQATDIAEAMSDEQGRRNASKPSTPAPGGQKLNSIRNPGPNSSRSSKQQVIRTIGKPQRSRSPRKRQVDTFLPNKRQGQGDVPSRRPERSEEDYQNDCKNRAKAVAIGKKHESYRPNALIRHRPKTPDPFDRDTSKRNWEASLATWRRQWKYISGFSATH